MVMFEQSQKFMNATVKNKRLEILWPNLNHPTVNVSITLVIKYRTEIYTRISTVSEN
jgi:hypothetical protein